VTPNETLLKTWQWIIPLALLGCTTPEEGAERGAGWTQAARKPVLSADGDIANRSVCQGVVCDPNASCAGTGTAAQCACLDGFEGDGVVCTDIDECADRSKNDCAGNATCINTPGAFRCECATGSSGDGKQCSDVDECEGASNTCDPNAACVNSESGFACQCNAGFSGDGFGCADIDECEDASLFSCPANARCENMFGAYACQCEAGFSGDGSTDCASLCEVARADASICHDEGLCRVVAVAAVCDACAPGFIGDGKTCSPGTCAAECDGEGNDELPNAICNPDGTCGCAPGYEGNVGACVDVDECSLNNGDCGVNARCIDLDGGHVCDCMPGFIADATGACVDIDECSRVPPPCHPDANCINVSPADDPAGFVCQCKPGFSGDGTICADIDECAVNNGGCPNRSSCVNQRGGSTCECRAPLVGSPESCHCDLTGFWAMRHDVDTCWGARELIEGSGQNLISAGYMEANVWELHELAYDGQTLDVRAKGCGADNTPDLVSPLFRETYAAYIPFASYDVLDMAQADPFDRPGIVPGSVFSTPSVAAVIGIDLGLDPLNAPWPSSHSAIPDAQWVDADEDGEPGLTLWPRLPSETTDAGTRNYSYLPAKPAINGSDLTIDQRAGCLSVAARVITHLEVSVDSCTRMTGQIINEATQGRVRSCALVEKGTCNAANPNDCTGWKEDIACTPAVWSSASRCETADLDRLDDDQNQTQNSKATFEFVRIGDAGQSFTCADVRAALPAIVRPVPTITCTTPQ
jgi:hypothetical protein